MRESGEAGGDLRCGSDEAKVTWLRSGVCLLLLLDGSTRCQSKHTRQTRVKNGGTHEFTGHDCTKLFS